MEHQEWQDLQAAHLFETICVQVRQYADLIGGKPLTVLQSIAENFGEASYDAEYAVELEVQHDDPDESEDEYNLIFRADPGRPAGSSLLEYEGEPCKVFAALTDSQVVRIEFKDGRRVLVLRSEVHDCPKGDYDDQDEDLDDEYEACCPACGEEISFCQGHGEIGDPVGHKILEAHDSGIHYSCHPEGCDEAVNPEDTLDVKYEDAFRMASGLKSDGTNPEYDRALVELTCELLGIGLDDQCKSYVRSLLSIVKPEEVKSPADEEFPWKFVPRDDAAQVYYRTLAGRDCKIISAPIRGSELYWVRFRDQAATYPVYLSELTLKA